MRHTGISLSIIQSRKTRQVPAPIDRRPGCEVARSPEDMIDVSAYEYYQCRMISFLYE